MIFPVPANEAERLGRIATLGLLDRPAPERWHRICHAAASRFDVPFAFVTILGEHTQYLPVRCGSDLETTERGPAFCNMTILHDQPFVVPDATVDRTFAANPYVVGKPHVRFYAGAPLIVEPGIRIGSLCIVDIEPRSFTPDDGRVLTNLARLVVDEIWLLALEGGRGPEADRVAAAPLDLSTRLTPRQIAAARGMLGWSVADLAAAAGVSPATVKRLENASSHPAVRADLVDRLAVALTAAGIEFLFTPGSEPGLRPRSAGPRTDS